MVEEIRHNGKLLALIISHRYAEPGVHFFTPADFSQQLAYMRRPAGEIIAPHVHNPVSRNIEYTHEVLFIKKGRLKADFYDSGRTYLESRILEAGDVILLAAGGHGFEVIEEVEMIEVKQGPYSGDRDKTIFEADKPADGCQSRS